MGIISQREVKEITKTAKLTIVLSIVMTIIAVAAYASYPIIIEQIEESRLEKDLISIECVYSEMQALINEGSAEGTPLGLWEISLGDFSQMTTMEGFTKELCKRLKVSSLSELEGDGFKSKVFKGSRYTIYMYNGTKELHLIVPSNDHNIHDDVVY